MCFLFNVVFVSDEIEMFPEGCHIVLRYVSYMFIQKYYRNLSYIKQTRITSIANINVKEIIMQLIIISSQFKCYSRTRKYCIKI